jgi:chemosensory pili system protein ChpA (sensor histidine kinase/response regulator)
MSETRDPNELTGTSQDIAPLAWVMDEIRTSLGGASDGIKAFLASKQDLDSLRNARNQIHQANGALQLLDLRGVALVTDAIEQLLRRWESEPIECSPSAVRSTETAIAAVIAYLEGLLSGRPNQPIRLFPYYREVLQLNKAARLHPADLIFPDLSRRPAFHTIEVKPLSSDQLRVKRVRFEEGLLGFLRDASSAQARRTMREALAELERLPQRGLARSFWWVVRGLLEALEADRVPVDVDLKRVLARLNLQLRRLIEGGGAVAERLMIDTLYYVGRTEGSLPRAAEIKRLYGLDALIPADFESLALTALDVDAIRRLKEALTHAKQAWSQVVGGAAAEVPKFVQEIDAALAAARTLQATLLVPVLDPIGKLAPRMAQLAPGVRETLGLEVASALMFVEQGTDELPQVEAQYVERARAVIARLQAAYKGDALPASAPWQSELARKAQDRMTMGSVVVETQTTLREIEQRLDRFFRNPADRSELAATGAMFDQVCGVLALLGFDDPVAALRHVQTSVARFADATVPAQPEEFARIAQNLGALGFFVETLGQDTERPRGMFRYDPTTGVFSADLGASPLADTPAAPEDDFLQAPRTIDLQLSPEEPPADNIEASAEQNHERAHRLAQQLSGRPADARAREQLGRVLAALSAEADLLDDAALRTRISRAAQLLADLKRAPAPALAGELAALLAPAAAAPVPTPTAPLPASQAAADRELHAIFVEEANEVLDGVAEQLVALREAPADPSTLTTVRRAFHTLKGSSRMVGLRTFGEGAWSVEQCFNLWLAQERPASDDLIRLADLAGRLMRDWIGLIAANPRAEIDVAPLVQAAQQVREGGAFEYRGPQPTGGLAPPHLTGSAAPEAPPALPDPVPGASTAMPVPPSIDAATAPPEPAFDLVLPPLAAAVEHDNLEQALGAAHAAAEPAADTGSSEDTRRIGPLEISHGLYAVFLNEADECIRTLAQDIAEWRYEPQRPVLASTVRRAHSLAGISATVGLTPVHAIADPLDDLMHELSGREGPFGTAPRSPTELTHDQFDTLERVIERLRGMLHQFAAGLHPEDAPLEAAAVADLLAVLRAHGQWQQPDPALTLVPAPAAPLDRAAADAVDASFALELPSLELPASELLAPELATDVAAPAATELPAETHTDATLASWMTPPPVGLATTTPQPMANVVPLDAPIVVEAVATPLPEAMEDEAGGDDAVPATVAGVQDDIDLDLLEVFTTEAQDLLPAIGGNLRALLANPNEREVARELMRQLHTVKGSARMAGAMRLGELVHDMETRIETAMQLSSVPAAIVEDLQGEYDAAMGLFERLLHPQAQPAPTPASPGAGAPLAPVIDLATVREAASPMGEAAAPTAAGSTAPVAPAPAASAATPQPASFIRVRSDVLDKLVDQAGEVSIARAKLENEIGTLKTSLTDMTENISRLRGQLREVEIQADAQIQARGEQMNTASANFDPLEYDRYTRLQELTRLLAESVDDVAMVQSNMIKGLSMADGDLTSQSRLTRDLQQQLMRVRLVPFGSLSERLYRVARQAAKELDKRVNLEIRGGAVEIDRGVLERMSGPFEHLVRNAIVHGIERPAVRTAAGKAETGEITIEVRQEGNEIVVQFYDDGAGLALDRIRARAHERSLLAPGQAASDRDLMELIFAPGFSTATEVTELAGRGVGMDVVRNELSSFGGRIAVASEAGRGTRFTLYLPLTLAVTQVVLATVGGRRYAIPAGMVEQVRRFKPPVIAPWLAEGSIEMAPIGAVVLRPLAQLLGEEVVQHHTKQIPVVLLRSGDDRLAIAVDDLSNNQEVVVKNVGPQVSRLAGILGATILGNGEIVLIVNPVQLISRAPEPPTLRVSTPAIAPLPAGAGAEARRAQERLLAASQSGAEAPAVVMVVDDSLTVRRVTQRFLERNGFDVVLAKDGVDALRQLQDVRPDLMLVDIEMPRMDGFDLTRNVRSGAETSGIPIIMITSRTAEKHRNLALQIGVNEYLGKPYQEEELLAQIRRFIAARASA